mgnify:CR=1 FL=1
MRPWPTLASFLQQDRTCYKEHAYACSYLKLGIKAGKKLLLKHKKIKIKRPCNKLSHMCIEPFRIKHVINHIAYELQLQPTMLLHYVFHVSLLELVHISRFPSCTQPHSHMWKLMTMNSKKMKVY